MPRSKRRKPGARPVAAASRRTLPPWMVETLRWLGTPSGALCGLMAAVLLFYTLPLAAPAPLLWDNVDVHYCFQKYFSDHVRAGRLPFWTPNIYSGMPFLADPQVGAWYPLN